MIRGVPDGYSPIEFGLPKKGDLYMTSTLAGSPTVEVADHDYRYCCYLIVERRRTQHQRDLVDGTLDQTEDNA